MPEFDLNAYRLQLIAWRDKLQAVTGTGDDAASTVELDQSRVGRLSRMDAMRAQAMSIEVQRRREVDLKRIAVALRRIDAGAYGDCLGCGDPIDPRRLAIDPAATHCIACASLTPG